jgi:undecaprenyl-diphosphatase
MNAWQALILGLVQGLTEFLPVSSSGHLALFQNWFAFQESLLFFDVFLHAASLLAIILFFWPQIKKLAFGDYWLFAIATLPAIAVGLLFENAIEAVFSLPLLVGLALIITGLINAYSHRLLKKLPTESPVINTKKALTIGAFQAMALIPGISRSGSTLLGSFSQGLNKERAFAFTFLLGVPAILGANVFQILKLVTEQQSLPSWPILIMGGGGALVASLFSLSLLKKLISESKFYLFSWYCLLLGSGVVLFQLIR